MRKGFQLSSSSSSPKQNRSNSMSEEHGRLDRPGKQSFLEERQT